MLDISQAGRGVSGSWRRLRGSYYGCASAAGINVGEVLMGAAGARALIAFGVVYGSTRVGVGDGRGRYVFDETSSYLFALWTFFGAYLLAAAWCLGHAAATARHRRPRVTGYALSRALRMANMS